jgi:hypothetical protein
MPQNRVDMDVNTLNFVISACERGGKREVALRIVESLADMMFAVLLDNPDCAHKNTF